MVAWLKSIFCKHIYFYKDSYEKWNGNPPYDVYKKKYTVCQCKKCNKQKITTKNYYV